jgi:hypothetical protein
LVAKIGADINQVYSTSPKFKEGPDLGCDPLSRNPQL